MLSFCQADKCSIEIGLGTSQISDRLLAVPSAGNIDFFKNFLSAITNIGISKCDSSEFYSGLFETLKSDRFQMFPKNFEISLKSDPKLREQSLSCQLQGLTSLNFEPFRKIANSLRLNINKPNSTVLAPQTYDFLNSLLDRNIVDELGVIAGDIRDSEVCENIYKLNENVKLSEVNVVANIFSGVTPEDITSLRNVCDFVTVRSPFSDGFFKWSMQLDGSGSFSPTHDSWYERLDVFGPLNLFVDKRWLGVTLQYLKWLSPNVIFFGSTQPENIQEIVCSLDSVKVDEYLCNDIVNLSGLLKLPIQSA